MASSIIFLTFVIAVSTQTICIASKPFACDPKDETTRNLSFCKVSMPIEARVKDLIGRLSLAEKVRSLVNNAAPIPRLGIEGYEWWSEALHGVSNVGPGTKFGGAFPGATIFPQVILTAAAFNITLWETIGQVVSDEARAMYNGGNGGLTYWSPNVNIYGDPRWGRGQETPGEDPLLAGLYAASYVRGLQGNQTNKLKVAACCKHFTAYDLDNWKGSDRFHFNAQVSKQELEDTYNVPFEMCVKEGKVASVMCSYNQVNGVPTCADPNFLSKTIRNQWNLNGYIVSDCDSVGVFYDQQHYTKSPEEAAAVSIRAGLNLDCGPFLAVHTENAVKEKLLKEAEINEAIRYLLTVQMRLGMFDGEPSDHPYGHLGPKDVCTPSHQQLALETATQGIVLLKNAASSLPLSIHRHRTITVIGPNSDATSTMIGNYAGIPCKYTTPVKGISRYARISHHEGCIDVTCESDKLFNEAIDYASLADATVLVMGLNQSIEEEMIDRDGLLLPGRQQELVSRVAKASRGPTILVLMSGGPIDVAFAENDPRISAIIWAGYPGQAGGAALADILFGTANPGGKLPVTWYPQEYISNLPMTNMGMRPSKGYPGRTYRFYTGPTVYPFGHGLSYTKFVYTKTNAPTTLQVSISGYHHHKRNTSFVGKAVKITNIKCKNLMLNIELYVKNVGPMDGSETILVFSSPTNRPIWAPQKQLAGFEKVRVQAGTEQRVQINIDVCRSLSIVDRSGIRRLAIGEHSLHIGNSIHTVSFVPLL